jgi:hypothetical protein
MPGTTTDDGPTAAAHSARPSPTTPSLTSPGSGSGASPFSAASSTNTSEPRRTPGRDRWPSSGTPQAPPGSGAHPLRREPDVSPRRYPGRGRLVPPHLFPVLGRQHVRRHPEVVTRGASQRYMINRTLCARQRKAIRDLGRYIAPRAGYERQHWSHPPMGRPPSGAPSIDPEPGPAALIQQFLAVCPMSPSGCATRLMLTRLV